MSAKKLLAVLCNDIHLSHNPPASRDITRRDWYALQRAALGELGSMAGKDTPIICAGDVFDKWNSPPELITFALRYLPKNFWSIPGQHDLPNHAYDEQHRSAYGTCVQAGAIKVLHPGEPQTFPNKLYAFAFPWGQQVTPLGRSTPKPGVTCLAVIHHFIWAGKSTGYQGAPEASKVPGWANKLTGYDVAHFGDNHKHFTAMSGGCQIWNGGGFMVRKRDERREGMVPLVAKLCSDGEKVTLEPVELPDSGEWFDTSPVDKGPGAMDMAEFVEEMQGLADADVDYREALQRFIADNPTTAKAAKLLKEALA